MRVISTSEKDGRLRYFLTNLLYLILFAAPLEAAIDHKANLIVVILIALVALYLYISSGIRRCNDIGVSRWLPLAYFVPVVNLAVGAYLTFAPSGSAFNNRIAAYCGAAAAAIFAIGVMASFTLTNRDQEDPPIAPQIAVNPMDLSPIESAVVAPTQPAEPRQAEPATIMFPTPVFDAARQAEIARKEDAERLRRDMESYKERERFYAKQYAERDIARCNIQPVMTDAEIAACRNR